MALSGMNSREKVMIAVLAVVIVAALVGIGILVAKLVADDADTPAVTPAAPIPEAEAVATVEPTITSVPTLSVEQLAPATAVPISSEPVVVAREENVTPILPVIIPNLPLVPGRVYRLEITAVDGAALVIQGSWSQAAAGGEQVRAPSPEFFEGMTPMRIDVTSPLPDPESWSLSVSAAPKNVLGEPSHLVITVYDVTGAQ